MKRQEIIIDKKQMYTLLTLVEFRLRYLEKSKFTATNEEARINEVHRLNIIWSNLVLLIDREG